MIDLKQLKASLEQLEEERHLPKEKIVSAIEDSLTAAYKKDYGKKGQIIRAKLDFDTGKTEFYQVKIVVDDSTVRFGESDEEEKEFETHHQTDSEELPRFNEEHHILLEDAQKIKKDVQVGEELIFPLEAKDDFGRIAAQTAKQVIIQRIREAEKVSVLEEYSSREGEIINGKVQKMERGNIFIDLGRTFGLLSYEDQIPGEFYRQGEQIRAYLYSVEETPRGINLRLSRSHPKFIEELFKLEAPEISSQSVVIKAIAREAGARTKIAVSSNDPSIDPVGSCVGQKGSRVTAVINELGGEKIDIIEWSEDPATFIQNSLSPAKIHQVTLDEENHEAKVEVSQDQFSLAVGKGGQNARLAAKLSGWKIDINSPDLPEAKTEVDLEEGSVDDGSETPEIFEAPNKSAEPE
ncbi:MAG: transcription termination/antitermination protein NusA [Candidatus Vogelbacteria bacterium CG22_combo_CG10-13_8_21_14_all_37_9]|uniref:Transcription termination/antitermination protein NusA n=1 Tax=Candidatus Vogelbacteria bacterium CG22_combo_CG10-13_8_21_14_all_37_9 TaxID=1975046 RepID=A0A2H0BN38_9BACT|nr:MAG: transcription termination/antitermination protein NusA [Candidatus Vogelbacteria bacterium CG22_combo_CG10-13_8_21_14_all_37_9]